MAINVHPFNGQLQQLLNGMLLCRPWQNTTQQVLICQPWGLMVNNLQILHNNKIVNSEKILTFTGVFLDNI